MTDEYKIHIAKTFVESHHKHTNIEDWQPVATFFADPKWLNIYNNMINGNYGDCRKEDGFFEIKIDSSISKNGTSCLFTWAE